MYGTRNDESFLAKASRHVPADRTPDAAIAANRRNSYRFRGFLATPALVFPLLVQLQLPLGASCYLFGQGSGTGHLPRTAPAAMSLLQTDHCRCAFVTSGVRRLRSGWDLSIHSKRSSNLGTDSCRSDEEDSSSSSSSSLSSRVGISEEANENSASNSTADAAASTASSNDATSQMESESGDGVVSMPNSKNSKAGVESFSSFSSTETPILAELLQLDGNDSEAAKNNIGALSLQSDSLPVAPATAPTTMPEWWRSERYSEMVVVGLAVGSLSGILGDLLANYEWVQTLRYFWPLSLGLYYGLLWNQPFAAPEATEAFYEEYGSDAATSASFRNDDNDTAAVLLQIGYVFGGLGLFVGGLADALLPVWMTGPNLLTHAGLAPDCAVLLLALSLGEKYFWGNDDNNEPVGGSIAFASKETSNTMLPLLLRIALWAELYKLGESSLDEVLSLLQTTFLSAT